MVKLLDYNIRGRPSIHLTCLNSSSSVFFYWSLPLITVPLSNVGDMKYAFGCCESFVQGELEWSKELSSYVLGSFFYGYMVTQVPGGWLASRYGGKHVFGGGVFVALVATILVPVAARAHAYWVILLRVIMGLGCVRLSLFFLALIVCVQLCPCLCLLCLQALSPVAKVMSTYFVLI